MKVIAKLKETIISFFLNIGFNLFEKSESIFLFPELDEETTDAVRQLNRGMYTYRTRNYYIENAKYKNPILIRVKASLFGGIDWIDYFEMKDMLDDLDIDHWEEDEESKIIINVNSFLSKKSQVLEKYPYFDWLANIIDSAADLNLPTLCISEKS